MPSIEENLYSWSTYAWDEGGDEWSKIWGGNQNLWEGSLLPRINGLIPTGHILEIAPGFGRITQYLVHQCRSITLVDLTPKCIEACRDRFSGYDHIRYIVNDGKSLPGIEDGSVDLVFSFDSLVHVEVDVMEGYLSDLVRVLSPNGVAFLHHSNMAAYLDSQGMRLTIENNHWRGITVSGAIIRDLCAQLGLNCYRQEIFNWGWGCNDLTDCFSYITKEGSKMAAKTVIVENKRFIEEVVLLAGK